MNNEIIEVLTKMLECEGADSCNRDCPRCSLFTRAVDRSNALIIAIEALEKAEMNCSEIPDSWIPCNVKMPEEHEWIGTKEFGTTISDEVYVTFENPKGERFTKHLSFQNGKLPNFEQRTIDAFYKGSVPIAWMPKPEPWEGEQNETD